MITRLLSEEHVLDSVPLPDITQTMKPVHPDEKVAASDDKTADALPVSPESTIIHQAPSSEATREIKNCYAKVFQRSRIEYC